MRRERSVFDGAIQIAGVVDRAEADLLAACGAEWLGFPTFLAFMPSYANADGRGLGKNLRTRAELALEDLEVVAAMRAALA